MSKESSKLKAEEQVKHLRRQSLYMIRGIGLLQSEHPIEEGTVIVAYQAEDGTWWFRPQEEFEDGRFEKVS